MKQETRSELQKLAARCLLETSGKGTAGKAFFFSCTAQGEGNTTVLCALGEHLGKHAGVKTLLVDGNLRSPGLHGFWKTPQAPGLVEACLSDVPLSSCIHQTRYSNVFVLPAGTPGQNLDDFFTEDSFLSKVSEIKNGFRIILFDSPPLSAYNDALTMGKALDGTILLSRAEFLPASVIQKTFQLMKDQDIKLLGAILNRKKHYVPRLIRNAFHAPEET